MPLKMPFPQHTPYLLPAPPLAPTLVHNLSQPSWLPWSVMASTNVPQPDFSEKQPRCSYTPPTHNSWAGSGAVGLLAQP